MWLQGYYVQTAHNREEVAAFLSSLGLDYDYESDVTVLVRHGDEMIATGSLRGSVLQCFGVKPEYRGIGLTQMVVDRLLTTAYEAGHTRVFVYTPPANVDVFRGMGFRLLVDTSLAALLEIGSPTVKDYVDELSRYALSSSCERHDGAIGGLVMNCNPFTLGHQYLVEYASKNCNHVFLLVVEEDRSVFPFHVRIELVKKGTAHLHNVTVLPSGPYVISLATFPSYFTPEVTTHARAGASVDASLYGKYVAKALGIKKRFVGQEPLSPVTAIYNATMHEVLHYYGVSVLEIPRLMIDGRVVSASLVRELLRKGQDRSLPSLVPPVTLDFLRSDRGRQIAAQLREHPRRH